MIQRTREEKIEFLVEIQLDVCLDDTESIADMIRDGCTGIANMTDAELDEEIAVYEFDEEDEE